MAEHTLYGKRKLCYTEVTDFTNFQGIGKDPLYKRFDSVYSVIENSIEPQYRDFLAHPIYSDEDQILWYVRDWQEAPRRINDLPDDERAKYNIIKERTIEAYNRARTNLSGEDKQILTGALKFIDEEFMFCYDNKIVVVAWGMSSDSNQHVIKGAIIHDLKLQNSHKIRFVVGEHGDLPDKLAGTVNRLDGATLSHLDLPQVTPKKGYAFTGWEPNPIGMKVTESLTFVATYEAIDEEELSGKVHVSFVATEGGRLNGLTEATINRGARLDPSQIPDVEPCEGYVFAGWDMPLDGTINENTTFCAHFEQDVVTCRFVTDELGVIRGGDTMTMPRGSIIGREGVPGVQPVKGYNFIGWDKQPVDYVINEDTTFYAQYEKVLPWYKRLWAWLTGSGCLKWLLWALLGLLLALLLWWLIYFLAFRFVPPYGHIAPIVREDGTLPIENVVAPIAGDNGEMPPIAKSPEGADIIGNRLAIFFEDANVNLDQFIADLSKEYPCEIIGVDHNIPMIQIQVPERMREEIRDGLNNGELPGYNVIVIDEMLMQTLNYSLKTTDLLGEGWHLSAVEAYDAWEITEGDRDVVVAVVDEGVDVNHELFSNRIVKPYNIYTQNGNLDPGVGHGTHVAGLAVGSNSKRYDGVAGIAPNCSLMPVQVFGQGGATTSNLASGIMYAINNGADVINASFGINIAPEMAEQIRSLNSSEQEQLSNEWWKAQEMVWRRIINVANEKNVIIVFAAGNEQILAKICPTVRTDNTINVAAVGEYKDDPNMFGCTSFSNYGDGANISAPGQYILSSVPGNSYDYREGTSMAAPIVTGAIALMKSIKPSINVHEALNVLQSTGTSVAGPIPVMIQIDEALEAIGGRPKQKAATPAPTPAVAPEPVRTPSYGGPSRGGGDSNSGGERIVIREKTKKERVATPVYSEGVIIIDDDSDTQPSKRSVSVPIDAIVIYRNDPQFDKIQRAIAAIRQDAY